MSSESLPINPAAFAEAIKELPLSAVYSKVAELRNSIAHLHRSNSELRLFLAQSQDPEEEKKELEGYVVENEGVIVSMNERVQLLKTELENRGQPWVEVEDDKEKEDKGQEPSADAPTMNGIGEGTETGTGTEAAGRQGEHGVYL